MKKLLSQVLVIILLMSVIFTGCSSKDDKEDTDTGKSSYIYKEEAATEKSPNTTYSYDGISSNTDKDSQEEELATGISEHKYSSGSITADSSEDRYDLEQPNTEEYTEISDTGFKDAAERPLSTFSIDVDTASYSNLRKNINYGIEPEVDSVRIEEMLNYFTYDYEEPKDGRPFSINAEIGVCPWNEDHYLLMVGLQGKNVEPESLPKSNLVFLIDVSGSMDEPDKLPLLKNAFLQLVEELGEDDRVSIVVYAGSSGVVLDSVCGNEKDLINNAIESLSAGGSTAGASGISLAYQLAEKNFRENGNNRVILATDGDFNVGASSMEELEELIEERKESGIFLSVIGFGSGNLKDNKMELLADKGNGNYSYIDSPKEARKVLVDEMSGTLLTIAKDVKIQLEFNPYSVESYRLIGYENRALRNKDFKNDAVDAGELGAGHSVTAIYEIIPGKADKADDNEDLKYRSQENNVAEKFRDEITEIRLRYKEPDGEESKEIKRVVSFINTPVRGSLSKDFFFAAAVAEFGMILRGSDYMGISTIESVLELAEKGLGEDEEGYRKDFMNLVEQYEENFTYWW